MSTPESFTEELQQQRNFKDVLGKDYIPTDEERRVLRECNSESFYYRSLPLSIISVVITKNLVSRGILSASPRFGSLPKVAFAAICGFLGGKISYLRTCQEKFKKLPNSPIGEILRQRTGRSLSITPSELSDPNVPSYDASMFQPADTQSSMSSFTSDYGQMGRPDDFSFPVQSYEEEEEEPKKSILYENLRLKNRENYEVMLNQKADTVIKASSVKEPERPKQAVKKNIYGDTWEE